MKKIFIVLAMAVLSLGSFFPNSVYAGADKNSDDLCSNSDIDQSLKAQAGCFESRNAVDSANNIINAVTAVVGIVAVIVLIYGGFMYATSNGNVARVQKAKNIIMYAVIGLIVAGLAAAIVTFVSVSVGN